MKLKEKIEKYVDRWIRNRYNMPAYVNYVETFSNRFIVHFDSKRVRISFGNATNIIKIKHAIILLSILLKHISNKITIMYINNYCISVDTNSEHRFLNLQLETKLIRKLKNISKCAALFKEYFSYVYNEFIDYSQIKSNKLYVKLLDKYSSVLIGNNKELFKIIAPILKKISNQIRGEFITDQLFVFLDNYFICAIITEINTINFVVKFDDINEIEKLLNQLPNVLKYIPDIVINNRLLIIDDLINELREIIIKQTL